MSIRNMMIILFALFIDGLQAGVSLSLAGIGSSVALIPVVGWVAGAVTGPVGIFMGFVINASLSFSLGAALILLLILNGSFYPIYIATAFFGEAVPGINNLPLWTTIALMSILKKKSAEGGALGAVAGVAVAAGTGSTSAAVQTVRTSTTRPANDNSRATTGAPPRSEETSAGKISSAAPTRAPLLNRDIRPNAATNDSIKRYGLAA